MLFNYNQAQRWCDRKWLHQKHVDRAGLSIARVFRRNLTKQHPLLKWNVRLHCSRKTELGNREKIDEERKIKVFIFTNCKNQCLLRNN